MEHCVASAHRRGVYTPFHVLSDREIPGCECYDSMKGQQASGLHKLIYLKAAISKLNFEYFVWIEASSLFVRQPKNLVSSLGRAPAHIPLIVPVDPDDETQLPTGAAAALWARTMRKAGLQNQPYFAESAFWVVHREAVATICDLANHFRIVARESGWEADATPAIAFAVQMLCGNPEMHRVAKRPDLWAVDYTHQPSIHCGNEGWDCEIPGFQQSLKVNPAIVHLPLTNTVTSSP